MRFSVHWIVLVLALPISAAEPLKEAKVPPPPMPVKSPVDTFRELLEMNSADRVKELSKRAEKFRKVIEERLKEFDALPRDQREVRLRLMQLRWELLPLLQARTFDPAVTNGIPEQDRALVMERLRIWQTLPANLQKLVLENEMVLHYFLTGQLAPTNTAPLQSSFGGPTLTNIQRWRELSPDEQRQAQEAFRQIFDLSKKDRDKLFSERSDRLRIDAFVKSFEKLSPEEREKYTGYFQKFTTMSTEQRFQFLQNATRWQNMSESQRAAVRTMITAPPIPPLPPEFFRSSISNVSTLPNR